MNIQKIFNDVHTHDKSVIIPDIIKIVRGLYLELGINAEIFKVEICKKRINIFIDNNKVGDETFGKICDNDKYVRKKTCLPIYIFGLGDLEDMKEERRIEREKIENAKRIYDKLKEKLEDSMKNVSDKYNIGDKVIEYIATGDFTGYWIRVIRCIVVDYDIKHEEYGVRHYYDKEFKKIDNIESGGDLYEYKLIPYSEETYVYLDTICDLLTHLKVGDMASKAMMSKEIFDKYNDKLRKLEVEELHKDFEIDNKK